MSVVRAELDVPGRFLLCDKSLTPRAMTLTSWHRQQIVELDLLTGPSEPTLRYDFSPDNYAIVIGKIWVAHGAESVESALRQVVVDQNWDALDDLTGRFVIVIVRDGRVMVVNDSFGARAVFYANDGVTCIGSQPEFVGAALGRLRDADTHRLWRSDAFRRRSVKYLPGDLTLYRNVHFLCPNNGLDIDAHQTFRYWPRHALRATTYEELEGSVREYFDNFADDIRANDLRPVVGLTAGTDSRLSLAGLHTVADRMRFITWGGPRIKDRERVLIDELLTYFPGGRHNYLTSDQVDHEHPTAAVDLAKTGVLGATHRGRSPMAVVMKQLGFDDDEFWLHSLGGEIMRGFFNKAQYPDNQWIRPGDAAREFTRIYLRGNRDSYDPAEYAQVYTAILGFTKRANYHRLTWDHDLLDMYFWEQRSGLGASSILGEITVGAPGVMSPNSRRIYALGMGLPDDVRYDKNLMYRLISAIHPPYAEVELFSE